MKKTQVLGNAISIAAEEFRDFTDRGGQPYILHCLHVMNKMDKDDHELCAIAVLHDVVEDTDYSLNDLRLYGFSKRVVDGVDLLTHDDSVPYQEYIANIAENNIDAIHVKLADLKHNMDITRVKTISDKDMVRLVKYHIAYQTLKGCELYKMK